MESFARNIEWIFSGIGVTIISVLAYWLRGRSTQREQGATQTTTINIQQNNGSADPPIPQQAGHSKAGLSILFIDDDVKFKVVSILKAHGWTGTRIIKDVSSLEQAEVAGAHIFFVDIHGVGKALQFRDEGLGLVVALKKKYPQKKVVIYSAETDLNPFHSGFKVADDRISKDADPYEFIDAVEKLTA